MLSVIEVGNVGAAGMVVFNSVLPLEQSPGVESLRFPRILKDGEQEEINAFDFKVAKDSIWLVSHSVSYLTILLYHSRL